MRVSRTKKDTPAIKIARYVTYQRKKREWSISELAGKAGLTPSFVTRLESGVYKDVSFGVIVKLAEGLEMGTDDFLIKCGLIKDYNHMPRLENYLKEQYQFPKIAIENVKLMVELMEYKYKKEIEELKIKHQKYWRKNE